MTEYLKNKLSTGKGFTHGTTFHADDVLSACLLKIIKPDIKIIRGNVVPNNFEGVVFDIGFGPYDHHQADAPVRNNQIPYAAFGLLFRDCSASLMPKKNASLFDASFVSEIDRCDNTPNCNLLSTAIQSFNPLWDEEASYDKNFFETVEFIFPYFKKLIEYYSNSTFIPRFSVNLNEVASKVILDLYEEKTGKKGKIEKYENVRDVFYRYGSYLTNNMEYFDIHFLCQMTKTYGKFHSSPFIQFIYPLNNKELYTFITDIFKCQFRKADAMLRAAIESERLIKERTSYSPLLILPKWMPTDALRTKHPELLAVVFKSERGGYTVSWLNKLTYPDYMKGKSEEELRKLQKGLFFVHKSGHMASYDTVDDAVNGFMDILQEIEFVC